MTETFLIAVSLVGLLVLGGFLGYSIGLNQERQVCVEWDGWMNPELLELACPPQKCVVELYNPTGDIKLVPLNKFGVANVFMYRSETISDVHHCTKWLGES